MAMEPGNFKRLVVGLQPRAADHMAQFAAQLAEMLNLDLLGVFLEDESLYDLASIPFARELRPLGGGWHPIDRGQLSRDSELAAQAAEKAFVDAAKHLETGRRFEVARGPLMSSIAAISRTSDILVVGEPPSAAERASQQFSWLIDAAFRSEAAVLIVPRQIARVQGPIVCVASTADDPSIAVATDFAVAGNENLVVVAACDEAIDEARIAALAVGKNLTVSHLAGGREAATDAASLVRVLQPLRERLVVLTRSASDGHAALIVAAARGVPVLVVEPRQPG